MYEESADLIVRLVDTANGRRGCVDYNQPGESWQQTAERLYNRYMRREANERYMFSCESAGCGALGGDQRYTVRFAWMAAPPIPHVDPSPVVVIVERRRTADQRAG